MNKIFKLFTIFALTTVAVVANGQTLSVGSIHAKEGQQKTLTVKLSGAAAATAIQFNLSLPDNVSITESGCTLGSAAKQHTLSVNKLGNGDYLFVLYNTDLAELANGTLISIPVTIAHGATSGSGSLYTIRSSKADAVSHQHLEAVFSVNVGDHVAESGDLNADGEVDVTDVVELIDMVLSGTYDAAADINGDGEVDVTDVVELIDMVLAGS